jgi:hypothetical protein
VSPIAAYLEELSALLPRSSRRRILAEAHAHLQDAAAAARARGDGVESADRLAVARFGAPTDVARQFIALHRRPAAVARRLLAVALATAATGGVGTATVWALEPGGAHHHAHALRQPPHPTRGERDR